MSNEIPSDVTFTIVIAAVTSVKTGVISYTGVIKEVDGVVVEGTSEKEVIAKIPVAIKAMFNAKRNRQVHTGSAYPVIEHELTLSYA